MAMLNLGQNIVGSLDGMKLTLVIDLAQSSGPSKSGKSIIVATTGGNQSIGTTGIKLGLNAYK